MDDERIPALMGRILSQSTVIEVLVALFLSDKSPVAKDALFKTLREAAQDIGKPGTLSDEAAIFIADSRVHAIGAMEALLTRTEALLATVPVEK